MSVPRLAVAQTLLILFDAKLRIVENAKVSREWSRSLCLHCGSGVNALDFQLGVNEKYCERELKKGKWYAQPYMKELLQKLTFLQYYGFVFVFHENTKQQQQQQHNNDILVFVKLNILGGMDMDIFLKYPLLPQRLSSSVTSNKK